MCVQTALKTSDRFDNERKIEFASIEAANVQAGFVNHRRGT